MLIGILVEFRIPSAKIVVELETTGVEFQIEKAYRWEDRLRLLPERLRIEHVEQLRLPFYDIEEKKPSELSTLTVEGGSAVLDRLSFGEKGIVSIISNADQTVDIICGQAPFAGRLQLGGEPRVTIGNQADGIIWEDKVGPLHIPDTIHFESAGVGAVKSWLHMKPEASMTINGLQVSKLTFSNRYQDDTGTYFVSTIQSGTLLLLDIDHKRAFSSGDRLSFENPSGTIARLSIGSKVKIRFEGSAEKVFTGPVGHDLELTPTLLEYFNHNKRIALIWGAFVMVWGMLWGAKRLLLP